MKKLFYLLIIVMMFCSCSHQKSETKTSDNTLITKENREIPDFSKGVLTEEILWYLGRVSNPQVSPDGKTLLYAVKYYDYKKNKGNQELYSLPVEGGTPTQITHSSGDEFDAIWRPDGKKIAYLKNTEKEGTQVFEANPDGSEEMQLTHVEGGVNSFSYSPDMKHFIYAHNVKLDSSITDRYPDLDKANAMIFDDLMYRHWDAWSDGTYQHLFITAYPAMNETVELLKDEKFQSPVPPFGGMSQVAWSPDGNKIAYCSKKMYGKAFAESTNSDIYIYDLNTKETINLTENNKGYDMDPQFSPDGNKLVWWSMATDGFESDKHRLFIHDFKTGVSKDYSEHFDQDATDFAWSKESDKVFFISVKEATQQIYELSVANGEIRQITSGNHDYNSILLAEKQLIATKTTHALPSEIYAVNIADGKETQLTFENKDILDKIVLGKSKKRWVKTTDGKQMLVWLILPPNFDSTKQYPALLYCQGGPQSAVSQFYSYRWNFQMMAAHDYIIVAPNRRGLPGFGQEWNDQISLDYGGQNMKDYLAAIDDAAKLPYVDANRLGAVEPVTAVFPFIGWQGIIIIGSKHSLPTAACSILRAGMAPPKNYSLPIMILEVPTGKNLARKVMNFLHIVSLEIGIVPCW